MIFSANRLRILPHILCAGMLVLRILLGPSICRAQIVSATLSGSVTDPAGATIPGANVTATNAATNISTKVAADDTGSYTFLSLSPGTYTLTVEKSGFQSKVVSGVQLQVNQQARVDLQLSVGSVTTEVEVTGAAPVVDTSSASIGTVISQQQVVDLPLNLRRFGSLAVLTPGAITDNGGFASSGIGSPFSETTFNANGNRSSSNNYLIDGVDSRNLSFGGFALQPPPDAVEEFKLQTNIYDAAFGKTAGSTINLVTRSGTNELHGTVYEFLRNDKLDARNFFSTNQSNPFTGQEIPGSARPELRRNQFGGAVGGPIRKNKTFFFFNYEGLRLVQGETLGNIVPTDAEKNGNLRSFLTGQITNLCGTGGPPNLNFDTGQLFNPGTESTFTCPPGSALANKSVLVGQPVPGNIITNIDPVAQKVVGAYPEPNRPGSLNYISAAPLVRNDSQFDVRIDNNFGPKNQFYGRYLFGQSDQVTPGSGYTSLPGFGDTLYYRGQNLALGWIHTFGPTLLNEARFGFQRDWNVNPCASCPRAKGFMASFGIQNFQALTPADEGFPFFGLNNFAGVGDANYRPVISPDMVEKYADNLTWTHGRHTVVVGADIEPWQVLHEEAPFSPHGQFSYDGRFSSLGGEIPAVSGISDLADLLLGYPNNAARTLRFENTNQVGGGFWNLYAQDNFKLSSKLTVSYGLRWEYRRNAIDKNDNFVSFVPQGAKFSGPGNGLLVTAADNATNDALCANNSYLVSASGTCLVASSAQRNRLGFSGRTRQTLVFPVDDNFAPRLGVAWRPLSSDKLIIRSGAGMFYDLPNFNNQHFVDDNPVFSPSQIFNTAFGAPPPLTNGQRTTNETVFAGAAGVPPLSQQFVSLYVSPDYRAPVVYEWSFGIESQLSQNWGLEVDYVGNRGVHLGNLHLFANQPEPGVGPLQPRRPYPDFNQILWTTPDAISSYNSLQVKLTKRFSNGLTFLLGYTWQHVLDNNEGDEGFGGGVGNASPQDDNCLACNYGNSYQDAPQRLVASYVYQLPFGKGKRFLGGGGLASALAGGWEVSGITSFQSGFPFSILAPDFSNTGSTNPFADRICDGAGKGTVASWFNTSCFSTTALAAALTAGNPRFGNAGRNVLFGPGINNWDFGVLRHFRLSERFDLEFRGELYDMFNTPQFGPPSTFITSSAFGQLTSAGTPRDIQFGLKLAF